MNKILSLLIVAVCCISCKKESNQAQIDGLISYKLNGTLIKIDNSNLFSPGLLNVAAVKYSLPFAFSFYSIEGHESNTESFQMIISTDSLKQQGYHFDSLDINSSDVTLHINHNHLLNSPSGYEITASPYFNGDSLNVAISSYSNGKISGTFSGKLTPQTGSDFDYEKRGTIRITDGVFSNVSIMSFR